MRGRVLLVLVIVEIVYLIGGGLVFWALQSTTTTTTVETTNAPATVNYTALFQLIEQHVGRFSIHTLARTGI